MSATKLLILNGDLNILSTSNPNDYIRINLFLILNNNFRCLPQILPHVEIYDFLI